MCEQPVSSLTRVTGQFLSLTIRGLSISLAKQRTQHNKRQCIVSASVFFSFVCLFDFFRCLSAWNEAFWSRLYGLNFISVSTEQCLPDWPVCFCLAASVKSVKWEIEEEGKSERKRGRKRKHEVTAIPQENGLIKSDLHLKNRKQVKCTISKDLYESAEVVFKPGLCA